jgi:NAD(P)-dependent dehydrogenase (short-subunit alcohol dehydrogenase family)
MSEVVVVIGPGSIGQAIARRVSLGKKVLLADVRLENAEAAAKTLSEAGFEVQTSHVDVSSRESVHALAELAGFLGQFDDVYHLNGQQTVEVQGDHAKGICYCLFVLWH